MVGLAAYSLSKKGMHDAMFHPEMLFLLFSLSDALFQIEITIGRIQRVGLGDTVYSPLKYGFQPIYHPKHV